MEISNKLLLDFYDIAQHCEPIDFSDHALDQLKKHLHFGSAVIADFSVSQDRKFMIQSLHMHSAPIERFRDRPKAIGDEAINQDGGLNSRDAILQTALARRGYSVTVDIAEQFTAPDLLDYCRRYETAHSLTYVLKETMAGAIPTLALWRAGKKDAYLAQHRFAADIAFPHIFKAREISRRLSGGAGAGLSDSTTALSSMNGCLYFAAPETIRLLQLEWKQWTPPFLPPSLLDSLKRTQEKDYTGHSIKVKGAIQGNMICLTIQTKSDREFRLTEAELRVARLAAKGLQYKEIARQSGLSPATIRNQLHSVYKKLRISNKTELAAILAS